MTKTPTPKAPTLRCAIYTRKSSEEGLEQGFNSLHAQREACEAYVLSQAGEGWTALPTIYDDGGWTGGNMERPGLQQLLADIDAKKIDVVVVYKVDRLTRSLTDFAKIVERFDDQSVSFVSVTQAFNTTSSMGRLTLNVLLSFAQFEREVTGERIRDKIAASKAKGLWVGGTLPLGYDAPLPNTERTLILNASEAETVRLIFSRYLELGSVHELRRWLNAEGLTSKRHVTVRGRVMGGLPFNRGALFYLLKNRVYRGEVVHKGVYFPARHPPIIDAETFAAAQALLARQVIKHRERISRPATAVLKGKIVDADGAPMSPSFTHRDQRIHRYYVSARLQQGLTKAKDEAIRRVAATPLEDLLLDRLQAISRSAAALGWSVVKPRLRRVEIHASSVQMLVLPEKGAGDLHAELRDVQARLGPEERVVIDEAEPDLMRIILPIRMKLRGGRTWLVTPADRVRMPKPKINAGLVKSLKGSHRLMERLCLALPGGEDILNAKGPANAYERGVSRAALLAPDIQEAILEGRQPPDLTFVKLTAEDLPVAWEDQRRVLGFS
jgi:site-specific DNA recombinase